MLKTVKFNNFDDEILLKHNEGYTIEELRLIFNPQVISEGVIEGGLNFNHSISKEIEFIDDGMFGFSIENGALEMILSFSDLDLKTYSDLHETHTFKNAYGICDNVEQVIEQYKLNESEKQFTISMTPMRKDEQPADGGWRWHKWGQYIGTQEPTAEYLYDEEKIDLVYVFHIYEWKNKK